MRISDERIAEYQQLYKELYNEEISTLEASTQLSGLVSMYKTLGEYAQKQRKQDQTEAAADGSL